MIGSEPEKVTASLISINSLVEIEEGIQLDEYGFNRREAEVIEGKVKRNESLYLILSGMDVSPQVIHEINQKSKNVFRSNRVKPGQRFIAYADGNSEAVRLILHENALDYVIFDWENEISVVKGQKEVTKDIIEASGVIHSSLYETLLQNEQSTLLGNRLSEIFAWQIDFFRLYPGDDYKVIYEQQYVDGKPYGLGRVLAAEFTNKGKTFDAYFFESEERSSYYDRNGNSVQKALLKAPFKFSQRVSSNFSHSRFHPVLKRNIPHHGVDYAAPLGTPVLSVGDGEVLESQYRGANGNIIKIRHNGTYTTAYLHLNGFAKGIRKGARVNQGQVIGYVGKTGRVTGVHLDYRVYKNGQPVNPLKVELPPSKAISDDDSDAFFEKVNQLRQDLDKMEKKSTVVTNS
ncbi:MAG: peptidoglycan DD-metalloendopeptidase family protein [Balneolaceae bacterium]